MFHRGAVVYRCPGEVRNANGGVILREIFEGPLHTRTGPWTEAGGSVRKGAIPRYRPDRYYQLDGFVNCPVASQRVGGNWLALRTPRRIGR